MMEQIQQTSLYTRLFTYPERDGQRPLENFLTEALADVLNRLPPVESRSFITELLLPSVGKSSLSRNILASAAQAGKRVAGVDLDRQSTLKTWSERRDRARNTIPGLPPVPVVSADLSDWRPALKEADGADVIVIDTPPSIEVNTPAITALSDAATLVLVPCQPMQDDVDSTTPWMLGSEAQRNGRCM